MVFKIGYGMYQEIVMTKDGGPCNSYIHIREGFLFQLETVKLKIKKRFFTRFYDRIYDKLHQTLDNCSRKVSMVS